MVATPEQLQQQPKGEVKGTDRVAVLLMGYGEVESYEDFANYNEQALNLLTAKFAPVPTWVYPPLARLLAIFDLHEWDHQHDHFISPHNEIFERQRSGIEERLQAQWGDRVQVFKAFNFCAPFLPDQVLTEIKAQGFDKLLIYPLLVVDSIFTSGIAVEQVNKALVNLSDGQEHWLKGTRYIPSFYNEPAYRIDGSPGRRKNCSRYSRCPSAFPNGDCIDEPWLPSQGERICFRHRRKPSPLRPSPRAADASLPANFCGLAEPRHPIDRMDATEC